MSLDFDWTDATTEQKAMLYPVCNYLRRQRGENWDVFFENAGLTDIAPQYEKNLRRGNVSSRNANILFQYLRKIVPTEAVRLVGDLRRPPPGKTYTPSSYQELLFRKLNYDMDARSRFADEEIPLDEDPDPPKPTRTRKARKKA